MLLFWIFPISLILMTFFFNTQLPLLASKKTWWIKWRAKSPQLIIINILIIIPFIIFQFHPTYFFIWSSLLLLNLIYRYLILYGVQYSNLQATDQMLLPKDPETEVIVINTDHTIHIYLLDDLRTSDIIFHGSDFNYSLTYCVMCNTSHCYKLPEIDGKLRKIHSYNGTVVNGNKILADNKINYVWQQFTGKLIRGPSTASNLEEIPIQRKSMKNFTYSGKILIHQSKKPFFSRLFFGGLNALVNNFNIIRFSKVYDDRLKPKDRVYGISIQNEALAYEESYLINNNSNIYINKLGGEDISLLFLGESLKCFIGKILTLEEDKLIHGDDAWDLEGNSLSNLPNLIQIPVVSKAYWYLWSQFHSTTRVIQSDSI